MSGYWNAPQATAAVLADGWFRTGDMGHLDAEGYLYVDGRSKDMIISGGENIYPAEIENLLIESPDIAEASVIGRPDRAGARSWSPSWCRRTTGNSAANRY
jgi:fatty-acyl-CoA synthase